MKESTEKPDYSSTSNHATKTGKAATDRRILLTLAFLSAFTPLSIDLYLPALPQMANAFHTTSAQINMTLSLFFVFLSVGILFFGPLSEKYGRKPTLYGGLAIYTVSSVFCFSAASVTDLIIARAFQAFGGGAATAIATAMAKDLYSGEKRARVLAAIMAMVIVAPIVAPMIGAVLLQFASWRAVFLVLAGAGLLASVILLPVPEPLREKYQGSTLRSIGRLFVVLQNPRFSLLLFVFSTISLPFMGYIAASSYIYMNDFGLGERSFSIYFALNSLCAMAGPMIYVRMAKRMASHSIITSCFAILAVSGAMVASLGQGAPYLFALCLMPATFATTAMRPPSVNIMLEQHEGDTGSSSSLINFLGMLMGGVGTSWVFIGSGNLIVAIGSMQIAVGILGGVAWLLLSSNAVVTLKPVS